MIDCSFIVWLFVDYGGCVCTVEHGRRGNDVYDVRTVEDFVEYLVY